MWSASAGQSVVYEDPQPCGSVSKQCVVSFAVALTVAPGPSAGHAHAHVSSSGSLCQLHSLSICTMWTDAFTRLSSAPKHNCTPSAMCRPPSFCGCQPHGLDGPGVHHRAVGSLVALRNGCDVRWGYKLHAIFVGLRAFCCLWQLSGSECLLFLSP
jgi:hypothetical protein